MIFDWDDTKAESNRKKHGVSFAEAATAFADPNALELLDAQNSEIEDRWILVGLSEAKSCSSSSLNKKKNLFVLSRREEL